MMNDNSISACSVNAHSQTTKNVPTGNEAGDLWAARYECARTFEEEEDPRILLRRADGNLIFGTVYRPNWEKGRGTPSSTIEVAVRFEADGREHATAMLQHECELTGRAFLLPVGTGVPALVYTSVAEDVKGGGMIKEGQFHKVHPDFVGKSYETIQQAIRDRVEDVRREASHLLINIHEMESLLGRSIESRHPKAATQTVAL